MKPSLIPIVAVAVAWTTSTPARAAESNAAAASANAFGLELHRRLGAGNLVTSPWSISSALAMTYAGAAGQTKKEMAAVLHFPADEAALHGGFAALAADLRTLAERSRAQVEQAKKRAGPSTPTEINVANRLFGQSGYVFETPFLDRVQNDYEAPLELMDFQSNSERERMAINAWVAKQTRERIKDLIPPRVIDSDTRLVLANAVFLKAPWDESFADEKQAPFFVNGTERLDGPGLSRQAHFGHAVIPGGIAVTVPYADGGLQFVLFVPDARDGLPALEKQLTPATLTATAAAGSRLIALHFPAFKLEPDRVLLSKNLIAMGMPTAFDKPEGTADFSRMAPRRPNEYLCIGEVVHQAFIAVDKHGTEAAAATAVVIPRVTSAIPSEEPLEVRVDRPFAFAIQHIATGTCLFLGRVMDPR
ncbi:MAG: serpin family protein [Verrucomicrobiales bacterium]